MSNEKHITKEKYYKVIDVSRDEGMNRVLSLIKAMTEGGDDDKISKLPENTDLQNEMFKKYHMTRWARDLMYRVNPFCPNCGEEHSYYTVKITEDEQKRVEEFYENNEKYSDVALLIMNMYPLSVTRNFECPCCSQVFEAAVPITRDSYLGKKIGPMKNDGGLNDW